MVSGIGETPFEILSKSGIEPVEAAGFDGVTAGMRVNVNVHAPLLCVTDVFDVASGDLSLPGKVNQ